MKIQPIDFQKLEEPAQFEPVKPAQKSRFKRLFERVKNSAAEKAGAVEEPHLSKEDDAPEFEPSSVCLARMVQNYIEDDNERHPPVARCGRNCFNRNKSGDSSEDDWDSAFNDPVLPPSNETVEILKTLVPCSTVIERKLQGETARIIENHKICKRDECRMIVAEELQTLGYAASIYKSRWEKQPKCQAGEHEYIEVLIGGERLLIDIDFRSEFELVRTTKVYRLVLQTLPIIFVGKTDRLKKIIPVICEAAAQSLKKKNMPVPPWRKTEYMKAKWLTPPPPPPKPVPMIPLPNLKFESNFPIKKVQSSESGSGNGKEELVFVMSDCSGEEVGKKEWKLPEVKPRSSSGIKMVTALRID